MDPNNDNGVFRHDNDSPETDGSNSKKSDIGRFRSRSRSVNTESGRIGNEIDLDLVLIELGVAQQRCSGSH